MRHFELPGDIKKKRTFSQIVHFYSNSWELFLFKALKATNNGYCDCIKIRRYT